MIEHILNDIKETDDCKYVVFGVNKDGELEHYKCYTYLQYNEIVTDMKSDGCKMIKVFKIR